MAKYYIAQAEIMIKCFWLMDWIYLSPGSIDYITKLFLVSLLKQATDGRRVLLIKL